MATTSAPRQKTVVDTPSTTPVQAVAVEVIDPIHPLFGRTFPLVARDGHAQDRSGCLLVTYRDSILIKLPLGVTNLSSAAMPAARTKLNAEAVQQLLAFVKECEPPCPSSPPPSGRVFPKRSENRSSKTSSTCSRR